jgi:hypothetical protein
MFLILLLALKPSYILIGQQHETIATGNKRKIVVIREQYHRTGLPLA